MQLANATECTEFHQEENQSVNAITVCKDKIRTTFTMTSEQIDSVIDGMAERITPEVASDLLVEIIDSSGTNLDEGILYDRIIWLIRCAFLAGFRDAATVFNDAAIMSVQELLEGNKTASNTVLTI
jgi:hypothetical protein